MPDDVEEILEEYRRIRSQQNEFHQEYWGEFIEPEPLLVKPDIIGKTYLRLKMTGVIMNFDQLLESTLFEADPKTPKATRSKLWQLEQELKPLNGKCSINSGRGERYEMYVGARRRVLEQIAKYRPLTDLEKQNIEQSVALQKLYYPVRESNETRLLASVLQKLDANPGNMPYNTIWTDMHVVVGRFGLTPDEESVLGKSKAWKQAHNGHEIDRNVLKLSANTPNIPITKKNLQHSVLASTSDRIREEVYTYFEEEEKRRNQIV